MAGMMRIADDAPGTPGTQPTTRGQMQSGGDQEPDANDPNEGQEPGEEEGEEQPNVSPEEQAAYDEFVKNGYRLLYDEKGNVRPGIIDLLKQSGGGDAGQPQQQGGTDAITAENQGPVAALANAAVTVVIQLVQSGKESGAAIPDEVIAHGGMAIMEDLATIAQGEKIHDYSPGEMDASFVKATQLYYNAAKARGLIDDEENLKQEFAQIKAADAEGPEALDKVLPGVGQAVAANSGGGQQPAPEGQGGAM